ncbi:hypothetical protein [Sphingobacterium anhuiense]|uniref:hypothetical protein n=1 Tax=Sphingobacterium anhuiense TaxID=493780 RepID=UPI003C2D54E8
MAIQILKQPADISWSRNPILYEFYTDQVVQDPGRPLVFELDFSGVENDTYVITDFEETWVLYYDWGFILSIGSTNIEFSCEYGQGYGKYLLPHRVANPEEPKSEWLARVRTAMLSAFNIGSLFLITVDNDKLIFTAKKHDDSLVISLENKVPAISLILDVVQTSTSVVYTPNLKMYVELFTVDENGVELPVVSAALAPDLTGVALWDFSKPLTSTCLSTGADLPSLYEVVFTKGKVVREYFIQVTELYGEPQAARMSIRASKKHVLYGGLPKNMQNTSLVTSLTQFGVVRFLTTSLGNIKVTTDQPNWLSWFNTGDDLESIKVQVELTYNDGTPYIFTAHTYDIVKKYEKLVIPIGLDQIGGNDFYPELTVVSYMVTLKSEGTQVSDYHKYEVDQRSHLFKRFFLYQNSLGAFESFYTSGRKSNTYEIEKSNARLIQVKDFVLEKGEDTDFDISLQEKEKINTGWKTKAEIKNLRDFFLSADKLTLVNEKWWPISVSSSSIEEFQDGNGLYALAFEITYQHTQEMFFDN